MAATPPRCSAPLDGGSRLPSVDLEDVDVDEAQGPCLLAQPLLRLAPRLDPATPQGRLWIKRLWQPLCSFTIFSFKLFFTGLVRLVIESPQSIQLFCPADFGRHARRPILTPRGEVVEPWLILAALAVLLLVWRSIAAGDDSLVRQSRKRRESS